MGPPFFLAWDRLFRGGVEGDDGVVVALAFGVQGVFDGLADGFFTAPEVGGEGDIEDEILVDLALDHAEIVEGQPCIEVEQQGGHFGFRRNSRIPP